MFVIFLKRKDKQTNKQVVGRIETPCFYDQFSQVLQPIDFISDIMTRWILRLVHPT